jgi:hypothetical protein
VPNDSNAQCGVRWPIGDADRSAGSASALEQTRRQALSMSGIFESCAANFAAMAVAQGWNALPESAACVANGMNQSKGKWK